ncbi:MAG: hypothetical protein O7E52_17720, partial [Candidatus Poribacteria bacterium]|nr:hypothetical protein [Candidatus Poribacteria bacterium]
GNARSVQLAGAVNIAARDLTGWQAAGAINFVGGNARSVQLAGAVNIAARNLTGLQASGAVNVAGNLDGTQLSVVNIAGGVIGTQIGVVNIARNVEGLQLGVINVAESVSGAPIGLLSFVKDNPLHLHFFGSDTEIANLGLRLGSRHIYNLLVIGIQPDEDPVRWSYGIGIGGRIPLSERLFLNIDGVSRHVHYGSWDNDGVTLLNKLRLAVGWEQHRRFTLFGGIALNVFVSDQRDGSDIAYGLDTVIESGDTTVRIWPGLFMGVQF